MNLLDPNVDSCWHIWLPTKKPHLNSSLSPVLDLFPDFAKMPSIRTTRRRSASTLRWSALRCSAFLSASNCESSLFSHKSKSVNGVSLMWHRSSVSLCMSQVGHCRTREVQVHRLYVLQRSSGWGICAFLDSLILKICGENSNVTFSLLPVVIIAFDVNDVASLGHVR